MSYNFDGTNDYLYTNTKPVSAVGFTVAMWVKRHNYGDVTNVGWMLGDIGVATDQYFIKFDASGTPIMGVAAAGSPDQSYCTAEVTQNVWSHVAAVFATDSSRTVYVHGGNATSDSTSITPTWSNIEQMRLGTSMTDGPDFDGQMAHVAVWNTALTAQNIADLAAGASTLRGGRGGRARVCRGIRSPCRYGAGRNRRRDPVAGARTGGRAGDSQGRAGRGSVPQKGLRGPTGVNNDPNRQPDEKLRALNAQPSTPGPRDQVFCTKLGTTRPDEMYIIGAHMDGLGYAEAANDNASGTAIVMEIARVLNSPDVQTERSIRFILWNNEETGLNGARAYVEQRRELQGKEDPPGSRRYPEPRWLGMIQHDMMLYDHGMPRAEGTLPPEQRPEADVNVEFAGTPKMAADSQALAWLLKAANDRYATDFPVTVGNRMSNTDSVPEGGADRRAARSLLLGVAERSASRARAAASHEA